MKILAMYQSGLGTSFMVEMNVKQVLAGLGTDVDDFEVSHTNVGSVSDDMTDYFFIKRSLKDTSTPILGEKFAPLQSIVDSDKVKEKIEQILSKE